MIDFSLTENKMGIEYEIDMIMQQIDILFDTIPREVIGDVEFGTQYDKYLHELKISNESLKRCVESDLSSLNLYGWSFDVNVYMIEGTEDNIAIVDIALYKYGRSYNKTYKIN